MTKTNIVIALIILATLAFAPWEKSLKRFISFRSILGTAVVTGLIYCVKAWGLPWLETNLPDLPIYTNEQFNKAYLVFVKVLDSVALALTVLVVAMLIVRIVAKLIKKSQAKREEREIREEEHSRIKEEIRKEKRKPEKAGKELPDSEDKRDQG